MAKIEDSLVLLVLFLWTLVSGLYFPQSELSLRIPYTRSSIGLIAEINLTTVRTLRSNATETEDVEYFILPSEDNVATLDPRKGDLVLHSLPKDGASSAIVVRAREKSGAEAFLEINIQPEAIPEDQINCTRYLKDMCFWNGTKYRIYENQPATMLGTLAPDVYKSICPNFYVSGYELLNGTNFFYLVNDKLYANESLDRDARKPPKGTGPEVSVELRCGVWEETTGMQYTVGRVLSIDVLDQNDNPPISQTNGSVEFHLSEFTKGDRLDENDLLIKDADDINTNSYSVRLLDDVHNAINLTFDTMSIYHPKMPNFPPWTAIYARLHSRTTLLPESPYRVTLQVIDESLLPGFGNNTLNITLLFVGPQYRSTTTAASVPTARRILYPESVRVSRGSGRFFRVAQPIEPVDSKVVFSLRGPRAFGVTRAAGIVYVANSSALHSLPAVVSLRVEWRTATDQFSVPMAVKVYEPEETCEHLDRTASTCATAGNAEDCEGRCGVGIGDSDPNDEKTGGCVWRSNKLNSSAMTEKYQTCTPNLKFCPDYTCDELEYLDYKICPQDCVIEAEVHFAELNKNGRGIRRGVGTCKCEDTMQCNCGLGSDKPSSSSSPMVIHKNHPTATETPARSKNNGVPPEVVASDARKATGSPCGSTCVIGIVSSCVFVVLIIIGICFVWRHRYGTKVPRRGCMHRGSDGINGVGILPLDYADRGDGLLIGLESLTAANRMLLTQKNSPPDPKWEFPRSRLTIEQVLGEGEFGRVLRAKAQDIGGWSGLTTVAVKTLKEDASTSELVDLLSEYQLLKETQHPNVIRLLGACTTLGGPIYLIIEFAEFGSLRNYLRRSRHLGDEERVPGSTSLLASSPNKSLDHHVNQTVNCTITPRDIISFAWQISKGMAYLAEIKLVHRDLAARNVLLATGKVCKISDFGLTRDVYEDDAYLKRSKGRVPVKWMAPESLADHVYTSKSDVWSFGVLLWELVTLGASPYPGVDVHNLYNLLKAGYRMEKPKNCSNQLYKLMVSCWHEEPGMRPSFKELANHWERMLEDAVEYLDLNPRTVHNQAYFTTLHALDSPNSSGESTRDVVSYALVSSAMANSGVNYMSRPSFEQPSKPDQVDKLEALWHEPLNTSFADSGVEEDSATRSTYVNEAASEAYRQRRDIDHYEVPIKMRRQTSSSDNELASSMSSGGGRPQSYIDMQPGGSGKLDDLLMSFGSSDNKDESALNDFDA
ncbi:proto-oncogene tyrosine-protein kinase receptor Ret [Copidosoma floridanum]|uniref:proto-oncogene tyrosine-protein kinase receptor Ret n=1 Tax=Copidosoma floridanum TaxID=29053 RepID=UPI0006C9B29E|nr:proto-oncogene tyrosine-protein kinase receptor Ret [Copidosoma floridanum]